MGLVKSRSKPVFETKKQLTYDESARLAEMSERKPADPTGRAYADWVRAQAVQARKQRAV